MQALESAGQPVVRARLEICRRQFRVDIPVEIVDDHMGWALSAVATAVRIERGSKAVPSTLLHEVQYPCLDVVNALVQYSEGIMEGN